MDSDCEVVSGTYEQIVECHQCKKKYKQVIKPQAHYGAKVGMDICPYCACINKKSYEVLFKNYKKKQEE